MPMRYRLLPVVMCLVPLAAAAQAYRCPDPATGKVLYTDQPCTGGALIAPALSQAEQAQRAEAARQAHERHLWRQEQQWLQQQALPAPPQRPPERVASHDSAACHAARQAADFRARSIAATDEQIRTARYNAALACGQQPPADIVVVQPPPVLLTPLRPWAPTYPFAHGVIQPGAPAQRPGRFGVPVQRHVYPPDAQRPVMRPLPSAPTADAPQPVPKPAPPRQPVRVGSESGVDVGAASGNRR